MKTKNGFTAIEICVLAIFLVIVGFIFIFQKAEIAEKVRDEKRKIAINAIHYNLEEIFYKENNFYPREIEEKTLRGIDPNVLTDQFGIVLNQEGSEYRYEPTDCQDDKCKHYSLRTTLEKEDDFIKKSRN